MINEEFSLFKTFSDKNDALELVSLLDEHSILYKFIDNSPPVDLSFSGDKLQKSFEIKIRKEDFETVRSLLYFQVDVDLSDVDKDYYLLSFADEELYEIILKPDEWGEFDQILAQKILRSRNRPIDEKLIKQIQKQRIEELSSPEKSNRTWIYAGYIFSLLGGLIGIFIGIILWTHKKTLPNGERVYAYIERDRLHGRNIFFIGLIFFSISIFLEIYSNI